MRLLGPHPSPSGEPVDASAGAGGAGRDTHRGGEHVHSCGACGWHPVPRVEPSDLDALLMLLPEQTALCDGAREPQNGWTAALRAMLASAVASRSKLGPATVDALKLESLHPGRAAQPAGPRCSRPVRAARAAHRRLVSTSAARPQRGTVDSTESAGTCWAARRTDSGVRPVQSRNALKKELGSSKPIRNATSP